MSYPLILDGAMGTELQNRGVEIPLPLWSADANIDYPEIITSIHKDYIASGADIITTNTFRTTEWTYHRAGLSLIKAKERAKTSLYKAVECAQMAVSNSIIIAGSVTTIEDCYSPDKFPGVEVAEEIYGQTLEWIIDAGVDVVIFETMGNIDEISCGLKMAKKHNIPLWLSMIAKDKYHLLDGSPFSDVFQLLDGYNVETLLTNCNKIDLSIYICDQIISDWRGKWGVYPNLGIEDYENDYFNIISDSKLKDSIKTLLLKKPDLIGLCCGSTPSHLQNLKHMINSTR